MYCIKCGKELSGTQVFCEECLEVMAQYPVPPETVLQLPLRPVETTSKKSGSKKKAKKKPVDPEEQLKQAKKLIRRLIILVIALFVTLGVTVAALVLRSLEKEPPAEDLTGKNYSTYGTNNE